jgi:TolA-binding protein
MTVDERIEFLVQSIESHDRQIGGLTDQIRELTKSIVKLVTVTNDDATAIRALVRVAESHEKRISDLEEGLRFSQRGFAAAQAPMNADCG